MSAPQVSNSPVMQHPVLYGPQGGLDNTNTVFKNPPQQAPMRSSTTNSQNISRARSPSPAPIPSSTPAALPSRNPSPPTQPRAPPSPSANSSVAPPITLNKHSTHSTPLTSSTTSAPKKASKRRSLSIPASAVAQSLDRDLLTKEAFKYDPEFERAAQTWIEHVTKEPLPTGVSLPAALKDGSVLCKLLNAIRPNTVRKIHVGVKLAAFHRENIQNYFIGCRTLGMNVTSLFDENDLYENKNFNIVLINIQALAALVTKLFPTLPKMDIPRPNDCLSVAFKDGTSSKSKFEVTPEQQEQLTDLTAWTNSHLVECGLSGITDVTRELQSGVELIFLLERLTGQSLGIYSAEPETAWNKMQNIALVLKFVIEQSGMHPSELCSCTDLYIGKPQAIIKLLTTLRDKFDMACTLSKLPSAQRRPYIISEVVSTEQRYVTQLQRIEEGLITPAKSCAPQMMTKEELSGIFGNIDQIMVRHAAILRQLQQGYPPGDPQALLRIDTIVEVFTGMLPWTKHAYSSYILNYDNSIAITNTLKKNTSWQALLKRFEEAYGMDISSFLVAPVQRLPRYLLLLRELVSCTPKTDPEYQILQDLWTKSQAILQAVNESKRAVDNANKLLQIAKSITGDCEPFVSRNQHFIKEGFLEIADADDDMESSYFFLLADRLILTIYNSEAKNFDYREAFMLKDIELVEERDSEEDDYSVALSMAEFEMELLATNKAQRDSWFTAIDSAVEEAKKG
ncbi:Guanine exchange factor for Rac 30 [Pelomyxa schiedti]|nr:Guanine exchange factor for Rac 30 [Pelomyxa schiedti]